MWLERLLQSAVNRTWRKSGVGLELLTPPHPIVRKCGELTTTEHTMMQRQEVAFINTGVRASPANNRGNDEGMQWAWGAERTWMILSVTRTEQLWGLLREVWGGGCKLNNTSCQVTQ